MRERGYEYDDLDDLYNSVYTDFGDRLHDITGSSGSIFGDLGELSSEEFDELIADKSAEEIEDYYAKARAGDPRGMWIRRLLALCKKRSARWR